MTILEALGQADLIRPNDIDAGLKLRWLSALDGQIRAELLEAHQSPLPDFAGYGPDTDLKTTELLVPHPYDELYLRYLFMRISLEQGELERYNNDAACFNRLWQSYAARYCRTHKPKGVLGLRF